MADDTPPPSTPSVATPYLVQHPDGSTSTYVMHTDRQPTRGEVSDYATAQGQTFAGFPEPPAPAPAPPPAPAWQPPPPPPPNASDADRARYAWALGMGPPEAPPAPAVSAPPPPRPAPTGQPPNYVQAATGYDLGGGAPLAYAFAPPVPAAPAPAEPAQPGLAYRAYRFMVPERSFTSQLPSIGGAVSGGLAGAAAGAPFGPPGMLVGGVLGAATGGGLGEAARYGAEKYFGWAPAEPGTFAQRTGTAAIRSGVTELGTAPLRLVPLSALEAVRPVAGAVERLEPILTGTAETAAPKGAGAAEQLSAKYGLARWWQANAAGRSPDQIVDAWNALKPEEQLATAGEHLPDVQTIMGTFARGAEPWTAELGPISQVGGLSAAQQVLAGNPRGAVVALTPAAWNIAKQAPPKLLSAAVASPTTSPWLASLPGRLDVAAPWIGGASRAAAQSYAAEQGPRATAFLP